MKTFADILSAYERETGNRLSPILERQISEITAGLSNTYLRNLCTLSEDNIRTIIRYVNAVKVEVNSATNYRRDIIEAITRFAAYNMSGKNKDKKFKDMTRLGED